MEDCQAISVLADFICPDLFCVPMLMIPSVYAVASSHLQIFAAFSLGRG